MHCMMHIRDVHKRITKTKLTQAANRLKRKIDNLERTCEYVAPDLELSEDEEDALNQVRQRCMEMRDQTRKLLRQIESGSPAILSTLTREIVPESEGLEDVLEELTGNRWNFAIEELIELIDRVSRAQGPNRMAEKMLFHLQAESRKLTASRQ